MAESSQFLLLVACILLSAFSSAMETALTAIGEPRARQLVEEGGHRLLKLWIDFPARVLATLLMTNTVVNTLSAALMTDLVSRRGTPGAVALATGIMTLVILTFGEITPKTLARKYAARFGPAAMPLVVLLYWALYPAVSVLATLPRVVERWFRGEAAQPGQPQSISQAELEYLIDLGAREGVLDRERSELLTSVMDFADTVTREIMVPRLQVVGLPLSSSREEVLRLIFESEHSRLPVYDGSIDQIVGVLNVKSLLSDLNSGRGEPFDLTRYLRAPFFVPETMKITRLLREFQRRKVHLAVVVDEFGGTAGVVALEDVVEEIVGEIQDEQDVEEGRVRVLPDGTVVADASVALRDLEDVLGIDFPDELDYDSLGGFVVDTAGKVPPVGSVVMWERLRFTVRAADERRVTRVEIARLDGKAPSVPSPPPRASTAPAEGEEEQKPEDVSPRGNR